MNIQERAWKVGVVVGILLAVLLAVLSVKHLKSIAYVGKSDQIINSITVNGKGEEFAIPDIATFSFTVTETGKTVAEAQTAATERTKAAIKAVRDQGVEEKDIQTVSYSISPRYEYQGVACTMNYCPPSKSVLTGYEVSQGIQVKVRELEKAGAMFGSIGSLGVQNVNGLYFEVDDIEGVKAKARAAAIEDAQKKAKELARQLGVRIVSVNGFYDSGDYPGPMYARGGDVAMMKEQSAVAPAAPDVPAGEQRVVSNVSITYEIK